MAEGPDASGVMVGAACDGGNASDQSGEASTSMANGAARDASRGNTPGRNRTRTPQRPSKGTQVGPDTGERFERARRAKGADGRGTPTDGTSKSSDASEGWASLNKLSDRSARMVDSIIKLAFIGMILSLIVSVLYVYSIGRCPDGETFVIRRSDNLTVSPDFGTKWRGVFSSEVSRECIKWPVCAADDFVFHRARGTAEHLTSESIETAALDIAHTLGRTTEPACIRFAEIGTTSAATQSCFRKADRDAGGLLSAREFSAWYACMHVPRECVAHLCA